MYMCMCMRVCMYVYNNMSKLLMERLVEGNIKYIKCTYSFWLQNQKFLYNRFELFFQILNKVLNIVRLFSCPQAIRLVVGQLKQEGPRYTCNEVDFLNSTLPERLGLSPLRVSTHLPGFHISSRRSSFSKKCVL